MKATPLSIYLADLQRKVSAKRIAARYYTERYANGWTVFDRVTDTNDGYIYATEQAARAAIPAAK